MFHDIGKIYELNYNIEFDYTIDGNLIGHIVMGYELVKRHIEKIEGFPKQLATAVEHMILSHHGEYEYGSPKKPKFIEALVLHMVDNLDAKVNHLTGTLRSEGRVYNPLLERYFITIDV